MRWPNYERCKASGVEWFAEIPDHWTKSRVRYVASLQSGENITSEELDDGGDYPVYGGNGLRGQTSRFTHRGHFALVGRQGALCGNINYANGEFWASEHAVVVSPTHENAVKWLGELLRTMNLGQYSVSAAQPGLAVDMIKALPVPVPPPAEQRAISSFLDRVAAKLDALVEKKRTLIEKLAEKRSALISRTVTCGLPRDAARAAGLDPHPKLKASGVEWLGEVPEHWEVRKFSREVAITEGQVDPEVEPYASMILIAPNHIESKTGRLVALETAADQAAESGKYLCQRGDVVYSKIRPALAKVAIAPEQCLCSADIYPMRSRHRLFSPYLRFLFLSQQFTAWSVLEADRVAMPKINRETLAELRLPVPPRLEQQAIASYLDRETAKIDALAAKVEAAIDRLQEYRAALITAAVTGKIDVRGAASAAPSAA